MVASGIAVWVVLLATLVCIGGGLYELLSVKSEEDDS